VDGTAHIARLSAKNPTNAHLTAYNCRLLTEAGFASFGEPLHSAVTRRDFSIEPQNQTNQTGISLA
jgi:hypothetical protein